MTSRSLSVQPARLTLILLPLLVALAVLTASPASAGIDRWTPFGPTGGPVDDVLTDPSSPDIWWIAAAGVVFRSDDAGTSWRASSNGITGLVAFLARDPGRPEVMYAATIYSENGEPAVFRSQDDGAHWTRVAGGVDYLFIHSLAVAPGLPGQPGTVFVGADTRLYRSADGGASFQAVITLSSAEEFMAVAPDFAQPGTVYAATLWTRYKSTDFGATWAEIDDTDGTTRPFVHDLVVAPGDSRTLYETGDGADVGGTFRSRDAGAAWDGPLPFNGDALAVDPGDPDTVYGGGLRGLFVSHDGGEAWAVPASLPPLSIGETGFYGVRAFAVTPGRPGFALAATGQGLLVTEDGGDSWSQPAQQGLIHNPITVFEIDPFDPSHWILASLGTPSETRDRGATFTRLDPPIQINRLIFDPFVRNRLWAFLAGPSAVSGLAVSDDAGAHWRRANPQGAGSALLVPARGVMVLTGSGGLYRSTNNGRTLNLVQRGELAAADGGDPYYVGFNTLVRDPRNVRTLYALGNAQRPHNEGFPVIYRSDDVGRTWRVWHRGGQAIGFDPLRPGTVHVTQYNHLLVTRNGGATFQTVGSLPLHGFPWVLGLVFDRAHRNTLYAATYGDGVLRSRDGGVTWQPVNAGLPVPPGGPSPIFGFVQDPVLPRRFYVTPEGGGLWRADFTPR